MINKKRKTVGLVLGGGAARGYAHLGILKVLEENKIPIDFIFGTSMGAVIGAAYALNPNIKEVTEEMKKFEIKSCLDIRLPIDGILKGNKIEKFLKKLYQNKKFQDTKIPFFLNVTDLENEEEIIFSKGDLTEAVRASISIPGIFKPIEANKRIFVDGGLLTNVQAKFLRDKGVDYIIAVNVFPEKKYPLKISTEEFPEKKEKDKWVSITTATLKSVEILISKDCQIKEARKSSDFFIEPDMSGITMVSFNKRDEIISRGEKAGLKYIKEIKKKLKIK